MGCSSFLLTDVFLLVVSQLLAHVHLSSDLSGEVLLLLLDALAGLEANGIHELDGAAQLLGGVGDILLHAALEDIAADELHLHQAVLLVELVHLAHDDLLLDGLGLGGHLGIGVHQGQRDLLLPASAAALADDPYCCGHAVRRQSLPALPPDRFAPMI